MELRATKNDEVTPAPKAAHENSPSPHEPIPNPTMTTPHAAIAATEVDTPWSTLERMMLKNMVSDRAICENTTCDKSEIESGAKGLKEGDLVEGDV